MKRLLLVLLVLLAMAIPVIASNRVYLPDNYPIGYTYQGYTKHADGWHFQKGIYDLVEYKEWVYGRWQIYYDFKYKAAIEVAPPEDWRNQFVKALRDKSEAQAFERSMEALGLQYGHSSYYQRSIDLYPTHYRREAVDLVNTLDLNVIYQQIFKNIEGMQALQSQASTERRDGVNQILNVQALREFYKANQNLQPAATIRQEIQGPTPPEQMPKLGARLPSPELIAIDKKYNCTGCHQQNTPPNKWSVQKHMTLDQDRINEVIERLVKKGAGHMPKDGPMLSTDEVVKFLIQ